MGFVKGEVKDFVKVPQKETILLAYWLSFQKYWYYCDQGLVSLIKNGLNGIYFQINLILFYILMFMEYTLHVCNK